MLLSRTCIWQPDLSNSFSCREKLNSMNLLLYMSPIAVLVLLPAALIMEPNVLDVTLELGRKHKYMWLLLLLNSTMAYSANLTNFLVTKHTSPLTLQVWNCLAFSYVFFVNYWHGFHGVLPIAGIIYRESYSAMIPMCSLCQSLLYLSSSIF